MIDKAKLKAQWSQLKGRAKAKWGQLTDQDVEVAEGHREHLIGKIQERYAKAREEAEKEVDKWIQSVL